VKAPQEVVAGWAVRQECWPGAVTHPLRPGVLVPGYLGAFRCNLRVSRGLVTSLYFPGSFEVCKLPFLRYIKK
jgi:hypothetical protein